MQQADADGRSIVDYARARVLRDDKAPLAWHISLDDPEEEEPLSVQVAKGTVLYQTQLRDRVELLQLD